MSNALALLNIDDARHLEHIVWAVYDGTLLVDVWPKLPGDRPWCTVLASLHKHIYRGCDDAAHCPPHTLGSWDCQERIEVLCRGGRLSSMRSRWRRASRPRRRSRSSSQHRSQTPAQGNRDGHSCSSSPHTPLRSHCGVTAPPVCLRGATVEQPRPPMPTPCPNWPRQLTSRPMPSPVTPVGEWLGPPSMMTMHGMMTSEPHTHQSIT